jgi:threonine/homoserine/homoserine lactone efflux protein
MYLAYLGVTVPLMQRRMNGWPQNAPTGRRLFSLGSYGKLTNVIAIAYGLAMSVNLCWPRVEFYGSKWYQEYGVMTAVAVVLLSGLALYYGYQESRTGVLAEHRADTTASLSAAMNEPPPIHGGP